MIHIAICDDEQYMADRIRDMAVAFFREKKIEIAVSQFANGKELIQYKGEIHILFLDIQMEEPDGMETARKLRSENFKGFLIFITVLKEMVFQAFEVQAYDYLVKPVGEQQFKRTMERLLLSMDSARENSLLVQKGNESSVISFEDIIFCEVIDRKIYLHLKGAKILDYFLVGNKLGMAENEGIDVSCSLTLPNPCHIADMDLGIILSNALDNAICACRKMGREERKYICVSGKIQGDFILLEIENSFCGDTGFTPGIGLGNIKATAEKYYGSMKLETEGTDCRLSVLLIISWHGESIPQQSS